MLKLTRYRSIPLQLVQQCRCSSSKPKLQEEESTGVVKGEEKAIPKRDQIVEEAKVAKSEEKAIQKQSWNVEVAKPKPSYDPDGLIEADIKAIQWRTPWHQQEGNYYSMLRTLYSETSNASLLKFIQTPINLSPSAIKKWWARKKEERDIALQCYIPERNQTLGDELAAAHFIVFRGGSVKFHKEDTWIKADEDKNYSLPIRYAANKILEAIDCSDMNLYYEGLVNLRNLENVKWLSLNGCNHIDDWCLDRISNIFKHSLVYLDLRNCPRISERGIGALYKMPYLRILYLDDLLKDTRYEMTCLLLQDVNPQLDIRGT